MALAPFAVVLLLLAICLDRVTAQNTSAHDGCIHMPIFHSTNPQFLRKRAVSLALTNRSDIAYYAELTIGNPGQPVLVQLDTGSFELWVNPDCTNLPDANAAFCRSVGFYDTTRSSTAANLGTTKTLRYGIGSANITYFTDDIALPGTTGLKSVQFGVATSTIDEFSGILGIGYGQGIATRYNNFLDELSAQNAIKAKAFTVALGSKHVQEGIIVFGGVDTSKFSGNLARLPIIPAADSPDQVPRYWIEMKSLQLTPPSGKSYNYQNSSFPVFLDSGATMTLLPSELAAAIAADFGAVDPQSDEFYEVSCDLEQVNGTLDFVFDGATIKVPYDELIRTVQSTPPTCFLGISPSNDFTLLGDSFMRSAYTTFDLENNVVWMGQADNCGSTPAALANTNVMSTLKGACGARNTVTTDNAGGGSGTNLAPSSATAIGTDSGGPFSTETGGTNASSMGALTAAASSRMMLAVTVVATLIIGFLV